MKLHISDLLDDVHDDIDLMENDITTANRILALVQERMEIEQAPVTPMQKPRKRRTLGKAARTVLIAAMFALALSVTAYAVYQARMADYLFPEAVEASPAFSEEVSAEVDWVPAARAPIARSSMSLVGYQGTPEYEAYLEWNNYLDEVGLPDYDAMGVDDTWHETPENYYGLYLAVTQEQAAKLDEIVAKYGLTLHQSRAAFQTLQELYDLLGTEPFLSEGHDHGGGYIYDDGAFKLEADKTVGSDRVDYTLFTSVKGSFSMISGPAIENGEEWAYTTGSGMTLDLVLGENESMILAETDNTYICVSIWCGSENDVENWFSSGLTSFDRAGLEAFAETIDFAALAQRYNGGPLDLTQTLADKIAKDKVENQERQAQQIAEEAVEAEQLDTVAREVVAELGVYGPASLPESYEEHIFTYVNDGRPDTYMAQRWDGVITAWGERVSFSQVNRHFVMTDNEIGWSYGDLFMSYARYYTDESRRVSSTAAQFDAAKAMYEQTDGFMECQVGDFQGFYHTSEESMDGVIWLDTEHDLMFTLDMDNGPYLDEENGVILYPDAPFTPQELIALAATITAE